MPARVFLEGEHLTKDFGLDWNLHPWLPGSQAFR